MLKSIDVKNLIFTNELEDDRTNTYLQLNDYDWMYYVLNTRFRTENQGLLEVKFEYFGTTISTMQVIQNFNENKERYIYKYDTEIFQKYISEFLTKHIATWNSKYAFNGEDIVVAFYNEVLGKYSEMEKEKL